MERIEHIDAYKTLLRANKQRLGVVDTNCMLMTGDMVRYIEEGRLFTETFDDGMIVRIDEGVRDNIYYYLRPGAQLPCLRRDKCVLIEEMDNRGSRSAYLAGFEPRLTDAGFALSRLNLQVERTLSKEHAASGAEAQLRDSGFSLARPSGGEVPGDVLALWEAHLDPLDIPQDHLILHAGESIVNVIDDSTGALAATIWWKHSGRSSECRHIVTSPAYLRRGLAGMLLNLWFDDAACHGVSRLLTWINEANVPSLSLFTRYGFAQNGRISRQYLLK